MSYHANYYNRYEDFFGSKKKRGGQKAGVDAKKRRRLEKVEVLGDPDDMGMDSEQGDDIDEDDDGDNKTKVQPFDPVAFEIQQGKFLYLLSQWPHTISFIISNLFFYFSMLAGRSVAVHPWETTSEYSGQDWANGERKPWNQVLDHAGRGNLWWLPWYFNLFLLWNWSLNQIDMRC